MSGFLFLLKQKNVGKNHRTFPPYLTLLRR